MPKPSTPNPVKLQTWIIMLLAWNLALLAVAVFYLVRVSGQKFDLAAISTTCAEAASSALHP